MVKNKAIVVIAIIGIALALILIRRPGDMDINFLDVRLYDENGDLIVSDILTQSIVGGVPGVSFIDLTVTAKNIGSQILSCDITALSPSAFNSAVVKETRSVSVAGKTSWTSALISVAQFEDPVNPTVFSADVTCNFNTGIEIVTLPVESGTIILLIQPEVGGAEFEVTVVTGGAPEDFCGDGICQIDENSVSCPSDCAVSAFASFRTTDLSYVSGSAIAFATSCGSELTAYGYETRLSDSGTCATNGNFGTLLLEGLPVSVDFNTHSGGSTGNLQLYTDSTDVNEVWVCEEDNDGNGLIRARYDITDTDASKVDTSAISFDPAKELAC